MKERQKPQRKKGVSEQLTRYGYNNGNHLKKEMRGYLKQHPQDLTQRAVNLYGERLVSFITKPQERIVSLLKQLKSLMKSLREFFRLIKLQEQMMYNNGWMEKVSQLKNNK